MEKNDFRIKIDRDEDGALYLPADCCGSCHRAEVGIDLDEVDILTCRCTLHGVSVDPFKMRVNGRKCQDYVLNGVKALEFLQGVFQVSKFVKDRRIAKTKNYAKRGCDNA